MKKLGKKHQNLIDRAIRLNEKFKNGERIELTDWFKGTEWQFYTMLIATTVLDNSREFHKELIENYSKYEIKKAKEDLKIAKERHCKDLSDYEICIKRAENVYSEMMEFSYKCFAKDFAPCMKDEIRRYSLAV